MEPRIEALIDAFLDDLFKPAEVKNEESVVNNEVDSNPF